jgi:hypothetical protein
MKGRTTRVVSAFSLLTPPASFQACYTRTLRSSVGSRGNSQRAIAVCGRVRLSPRLTKGMKWNTMDSTYMQGRGVMSLTWCKAKKLSGGCCSRRAAFYSREQRVDRCRLSRFPATADWCWNTLSKEKSSRLRSLEPSALLAEGKRSSAPVSPGVYWTRSFKNGDTAPLKSERGTDRSRRFANHKPLVRREKGENP